MWHAGEPEVVRVAAKRPYLLVVLNGDKSYVKMVSGANGKNLLVGETYYSPSNAKRAANRLAAVLDLDVKVKPAP